MKVWKSTHRKILLTSKLPPKQGYLRIRYEDLGQEPEETVAKVIAFLGLEPENLFTVQPNPKKPRDRKLEKERL